MVVKIVSDCLKLLNFDLHEKILLNLLHNQFGFIVTELVLHSEDELRVNDQVRIDRPRHYHRRVVDPGAKEEKPTRR